MPNKLSDLKNLLIDRGVTIVEHNPVTKLVVSGGAMSEAVTLKGRFGADHFILVAGHCPAGGLSCAGAARQWLQPDHGAA